MQPQNSQRFQERRGVVDVLVVDDDAEVRRSVVDVLTEWGFAVAEAADGEAALAVVDGGIEPRALLLDLHMPGMDGWAVLEARKGHPRLASVPVVLLTAARERAIGLEETIETLEKPLSVERLLAAMRRASTIAVGRLHAKSVA